MTHPWVPLKFYSLKECLFLSEKIGPMMLVTSLSGSPSMLAPSVSVLRKVDLEYSRLHHPDTRKAAKIFRRLAFFVSNFEHCNRVNKGRFRNTIVAVAWFTPQFKAISDFRQKKFSQPVLQNKRSRKVALKPVRQTLTCCGIRQVTKRSYMLISKTKGKYKVLSGGFCLRVLEAEHKALQLLHIHC